MIVLRIAWDVLWRIGRSTLGDVPRGAQAASTAHRLLSEDSGGTAVEYALILAAIAGLLLVIVLALGKKTNGLLQSAALWH